MNPASAKHVRSTIFSRSCVWFFVLCLIASGNARAWQMKQAPLMTQWASQVDTNNPLPEYPRPQMVRSNWLNLNGIWQFQPGITNSDPVPFNQTLSGSILVPYPMESAISGVMQYHAWSWYRTTFIVPVTWSGQKILLHLDAVNWQSQVYLNGHSVGVHKGGYDPITYDITPYLSGTGSQELIVQVYDPVDNGGQPRGKQTLYPGGIMYTSSSGIWQPAWLEPVSSAGIQNLVIIPDVDHSQLRLTVKTYATSGVTISATALAAGTTVNTVSGNPNIELDIPIPSPKLWSPDSPFLYDLQISVIQNGQAIDTVTSYFGMRKISTSTVNGTPEIFLNNQSIFQMGPLDQGFWPDGIYTAPTDAALKFDIQQEKALGFNTVRKHIKVERARWYYWADKLGIMVWQDMPSCNSYTGNPTPPPVDARQFIAELSGLVTNHWNSPAIIMWDIFNESQGQENTSGGVGQTNTAYLVQLVKGLDASRLVNQASGGSYYGVGDVLDNHSYPAPGDPTSSTQAPVDGEFGGIGFQVAGHLWNPALAGGDYIGANTTADIAPIYDSFINDLIYYKSSTGLNAAIYTQITDVENECNGLMTYDRLLKPDPAKIEISNQKAISGQFQLTTILPTSQNQGFNWNYVTNYTTDTIPANWYATNFNDSSWSSAPAGFGTPDPGVTPRTSWVNSDIWMRRKFTWGNLTGNDLSNLVFNCYHDEDCEIYLNGVLAGSASGYSTSYVLLPMNMAGMAAFIPNSSNLIAIHCHQTTGGQFIDSGISEQVITANTLTVPSDFIGYWPLDETNGIIADDLSGNGNNGLVKGAVWNAYGKVHGCMSFNGLNDSVEINRAISNDFSISFWVKTLQTGNTGPWWAGRGLVGEDFSQNANVFGTSLNGSKFAFGVENPDTTITSTTSINDGNWHQCVATRTQSTSLICLYVDGNLEATGTANTNSLTASNSLFFGAIASGGGYLNGSLDEVKIFSRALGNLEIEALYSNIAYTATAPANVIASAGNAQVVLNWNESLWASSYVVSRSTMSGGPYVIVNNPVGTAFTDRNVANGSTYYYVVAAVDSAGNGVNSSEVSAKPINLTEWFKADAIQGLANGSRMSVWPDASGNGNDATQAISQQQPTYVTGAMNGLPVVRFNAANSNYLSFNRSIQDDFTIICVFRSTQGIGTGTAYFQGAGLVNGEVAGVANDFGISLNATGELLAGSGNPDTTIVSEGSNYNNSRPYVMTFQRTMTNGLLALYVDGVLEGTAAGGTQSLTAPPRLVMGAQQTLLNFLTGDIAEVKIFNSALPASDRIAEENALGCKYGLGFGAPPTIPVGLNATPVSLGVSLGWLPTPFATSYNLYWSTNNGVSYTLKTVGITTTNYVDTNEISGWTNYYALAAVDGCGASSNSSAVSIFIEPPTLTVSFGVGSVTINWPASATGWSLRSTTSLAPPVNWSLFPNSPILTNGQYTVTAPLGPNAQFFSLTRL